MSASQPLEATLLKLFAAARDHKLAATSLKTKLAAQARKDGTAPDAEAVDHAIAALIDDGRLAVTGAGKDGHHPRPKGSYRLTGAGKDHVKPPKPDASDETIAFQEAYLLLQMMRFDGRTASRSKLNEKLKSAAARQNLDFSADVFKETVDYHIANLVQAGSLDERRQGVSLIYTLTDDGLKALGAANQHETVEFRLPGSALNALLEAARDSSATTEGESVANESDAGEPALEPSHPTASKASEVEPRHIHDFVAQLKADKYSGRNLVPIHEVRRLVREEHGDQAASHPVFDRLLKTMRSEDEIKIIAISDSRDTPQQHLDDSIPGMNETLFFIDTK